MEQMDKTGPVLVTGATGYVAGWLVKKLLEEGFTVHAAVRDPDNKKKIAHLEALAEKSKGVLKFFKSDLLKEGSYADAMQSCEIVFHTASPFKLDVNDPQKELVEPALSGTENVLNEVNRTESVKRVVLTSSCAAIYSDTIEAEEASGGMLTEEMWNTTSSLEYQPYAYSKTVAERKAWEIAESQDRWDMVVINPSLVMGPFLTTASVTSESYNLLKQMGDGTFQVGVPKMGVGIVDVRDVAEAHFQAAFRRYAKGRYITSGHNSDFLEVATILHNYFGDQLPIPKRALPKWLVWLVGPMLNKSLTREYISKNVNRKWAADNSKVKEQLGIEFRPLRETLKDTFQVLLESGTFNK